jgi:FeS assembly SUF system protein
MEAKAERIPLPLDAPAAPHPEGRPALTNPAPAPANPAAAGPLDISDLQEQIISALRSCFDPEIPVNIYELGLIYGIDVQPTGAVDVKMTLTSPACPVAGSLPPEVQAKISSIPGVSSAKVDVVWDPPWTPDRMSEAAKLQLGMF